MHICFIIAMETEALPLIKAMALEEIEGFAPGLPPRAWGGYRGNNRISIVINGKDPTHGLDLIGTQAAVLSTFVAATTLAPCLLISAGTAGAFQSKGAAISDVYLSYPKVVFHDRRVDIPGWDEMGVGNFEVLDVRAMAGALKLKTGIITTGNSLDMSPIDHEVIKSLGGEVKEMEGAAVAWVASLFNIPVFCVKSITDFVDNHQSTAGQFRENFRSAVESLTAKTIEIVDHLLVETR